MSAEFPPIAEVGEENVRQRMTRIGERFPVTAGMLHMYQEEDFDE